MEDDELDEEEILLDLAKTAGLTAAIELSLCFLTEELRPNINDYISEFFTPYFYGNETYRMQFAVSYIRELREPPSTIDKMRYDERKYVEKLRKYPEEKLFREPYVVNTMKILYAQLYIAGVKELSQNGNDKIFAKVIADYKAYRDWRNNRPYDRAVAVREITGFPDDIANIIGKYDSGYTHFIENRDISKILTQGDNLYDDTYVYNPDNINMFRELSRGDNIFGMKRPKRSRKGYKRSR